MFSFIRKFIVWKNGWLMKILSWLSSLIMLIVNLVRLLVVVKLCIVCLNKLKWWCKVIVLCWFLVKLVWVKSWLSVWFIILVGVIIVVWLKWIVWWCLLDCWKVICLVMSVGFLLVLVFSVSVVLNWWIKVPCFLMKWVICYWSYSWSCCVYCRNRSLNVLVVIKLFRWMCV